MTHIEENSNEINPEDNTFNISGNAIRFYGDIDTKNCFNLIKYINFAVNNLKSSNLIPVPNHIDLYINSDGGEIYRLFGVLSFLKNLPYKIVTHVEGYCASAAALLVICGDYRVMTKGSYMLIHEIRSECWGTYSNCKDDMENNNKLMKHINKIIIKKSQGKFPEHKLNKIMKRDLLLSAKMCLKYGLIDEIV